MFKKPTETKGNNTSKLSLDVSKDVLQKLEQIARHQSTWDVTAKRVEVEDVVRKALNAYVKGRVDDSGVVLPM